MRLPSMHCALLPQEVISLIQKARPSASGSRLRKSRYCQRTKVCASSMGLETRFELGSYSSALFEALNPLPPAASTLPVRRSVAVWKRRPLLRLPVLLHVLVAGSYNSDRSVMLGRPSIKNPPATRTLPVVSNVAV